MLFDACNPGDFDGKIKYHKTLLTNFHSYISSYSMNVIRLFSDQDDSRVFHWE